MATSDYPRETMAEYEGPPLRRLLPEQPKLTRTLQVSVSVDKGGNANFDGELSPTLRVTWKPTQPLDQTKPTLRWGLNVQQESPRTVDTFKDVVIEHPGQQVTGSNHDFYCAYGTPCERRVLFTLEVLPASAQGVLEVEWKVEGSASTSDTSKEFRMQITEP